MGFEREPGRSVGLQAAQAEQEQHGENDGQFQVIPRKMDFSIRRPKSYQTLWQVQRKS